MVILIGASARLRTESLAEHVRLKPDSTGDNPAEAGLHEDNPG